MGAPAATILGNDPIGRLMMAAVMGICGWLVYTVQGLTITVAVQTATLVSLQGQLTAERSERYTAVQAKADHALLSQRIQRLEEWAPDLSERLRELQETSHQ